MNDCFGSLPAQLRSAALLFGAAQDVFGAVRRGTAIFTALLDAAHAEPIPRLVTRSLPAPVYHELFN